jgi:Domain of unknown function (DUF4386)
MTEAKSKTEAPSRLTLDAEWKPFIRAGGITTFVMGILFLIAGGFAPSIINIPFASSVQSALQALNSNGLSWEVVWTIGAIVDLLFLVVFAAFYAALRRIHPGLSIVSLILLVVSMTIDLAGDIPLRYVILGIANSYASTSNQSQQAAYLATAEMTQSFSGVVGLISTLILAVATVLISYAMLRSSLFGRVMSYLGIVAGISRWPASIWFYQQTPGFPNLLGFFLLGLTSVTYILWALLSGYRLYGLGSSRFLVNP